MKHTYQVDESADQQRADVFVTEQLGTLTRSQVRKLFDEGKVTADGKAIKPADTVRGTIEVTTTAQSAQPIELPVVYEDDDVIVIDKPAGILVHAKGPVSEEFTVADFIKPLTTDTSAGRAGIVHRLDRVTSGVMILAKSSEARVMLQKQFAKRTAQKTYTAVVEGIFDPPKQRFEWPLERNPKKPSTFRVGSNGKPAATAATLESTSAQHSKLTLKPETGRTHQLRVHLAHAGYPIVGDELYGGNDAERLMLHAWKLQLTLPNGRNQVFEAPIPKEFA